MRWCIYMHTWWRHQMETFSALLAICAGNSQVPGEFPTQMPVTRSFDVYFDLHPNKWFRKQWWGWWFETPSPPLWRNRDEKKRVLRGSDNKLSAFWSKSYYSNQRWHILPLGPPEKKWAHFNKEIGFLCGLKFYIEYILWGIPTIETTFDVANMGKTATVKYVPINNDALLNIQAC